MPNEQDVVWQIISEDIPPLITAIEDILAGI
jgi:uncharacterized protein with HEPN domain